MVLKIVHYNDPLLRRKGEKIGSFDDELGEFAADLIETMRDAGGIGLAAQQVGRPMKLFVADLRESKAKFSWKLDGARPPLELFMPMIVANPEVEPDESAEEQVAEEGCLSFPEIRGEVLRPGRITLRYQDERGLPHVLECDGLLARCVQHETDHVNGVLFIERMTEAARESVDADVRALAKRTRELAREQEKAT